MNLGNEFLLSDIQILARLVAEDEKCIFVSPLICPDIQIGPSSLDVHLGAEIKTPVTTAATHIDLAVEAVEVRRQVAGYFRTEKVGVGGAFVLHPGEFTLASTLEFVRLPRDIAARLEGRSSIGRLGIEVHSTAGYVDPGFEGTLTFELSNVGRLPVRMRPGLRIAQLCFFRVDEVQADYKEKKYSKYAGAFGAGLSRIDLDPELCSDRLETGPGE